MVHFHSQGFWGKTTTTAILVFLFSPALKTCAVTFTRLCVGKKDVCSSTQTLLLTAVKHCLSAFVNPLKTWFPWVEPPKFLTWFNTPFFFLLLLISLRMTFPVALWWLPLKRKRSLNLMLATVWNWMDNPVRGKRQEKWLSMSHEYRMYIYNLACLFSLWGHFTSVVRKDLRRNRISSWLSSALNHCHSFQLMLTAVMFNCPFFPGTSVASDYQQVCRLLQRQPFLMYANTMSKRKNINIKPLEKQQSLQISLIKSYKKHFETIWSLVICTENNYSQTEHSIEFQYLKQ